MLKLTGDILGPYIVRAHFPQRLRAQGLPTTVPMNFSLVVDSPFNTTLLSPEGRMVYRIETNTPNYSVSGTLITTVSKVSPDGQTKVELGRIAWQSGRPGTVIVHGHELYIARNKLWGSYVQLAFPELSHGG